MADTMLLFLSLTGGLLLGVFFYGGLWWTVRKGLASPRPTMWFPVSFLLRTCIMLGGMYAFAGARWQRLLACLLGFFAVRLFVMLLNKTAGPGGSVREDRHAA